METKILTLRKPYEYITSLLKYKIKHSYIQIQNVFNVPNTHTLYTTK